MDLVGGSTRTSVYFFVALKIRASFLENRRFLNYPSIHKTLEEPTLRAKIETLQSFICTKQKIQFCLKLSLSNTDSQL